MRKLEPQLVTSEKSKWQTGLVWLQNVLFVGQLELFVEILCLVCFTHPEHVKEICFNELAIDTVVGVRLSIINTTGWRVATGNLDDFANDSETYCETQENF